MLASYLHDKLTMLNVVDTDQNAPCITLPFEFSN